MITTMQSQTKTKITAQRIATVAILSSLALIFSYVEAIIPYNPGIPGIKLGIANIVAIIALYKLSVKDAILINFIRIIIAGLLFNGLFGTLYSLCGATVSMTGMVLLKKTNKFTIVGVSMAGGVLHNLGQLILAGFIIEDVRIFYYFPVLMVSGIISGIAIGIGGYYIVRALPDLKSR